MKRCGALLGGDVRCRQRVGDDAFACWRPGHDVARALEIAAAVRGQETADRVSRSRTVRGDDDEGLLLAPVTRDQIVGTVDILNRHGVAYVVIGGVGLDLQGVGITSFDLDVTPERSRENLERLAAALKELNARIRVDGEPDGIPFDVHWSVFEGRPFLNLVTDLIPLDICLEPAGISGYEELAASVVNISIGSTTVPVGTVADIARSKEAARRPKDQRVLPRILAFLAARDRLSRR